MAPSEPWFEARRSEQAAGVAERVQMIVLAAERAASGIRSDAERRAETLTHEAQERAAAAAEERIEQVSGAADAIMARLLAVRQSIDQLAETVEEMTGKLADSVRGAPRSETRARVRTAPASSAEPPQALAGDERASPDRASSEGEHPPGGPRHRFAPRPAPAGPDDPDAARVVAMNLAAGGMSREEAKAELADRFGDTNLDPILDDLYMKEQQ